MPEFRAFEFIGRDLDLTLTLLVLWIGTNHHDSTATTNDAALLANLLDGCSNFHFSLSSATNFILYQFLSEMTKIGPTCFYQDF